MLKPSQNDTEYRIDSLIQLMNLDEKIGQTVMYSSTKDVTGPTLDNDFISYIEKGQVGAVFNATGTKHIYQLQKIAVEKTRLGIPLLFGYDIIHGYQTIFPIPLAESCSWDLQLMEKTARIAALEAAASGLHWTFAPMVDISRDPRWGRVAEGAGEDTYLASCVAKARVRGFQNNLEHGYKFIACAKHFAGYGNVQAGRDYNTVDMSEIQLRNIHLPPFKAALDQGVASIMTAFNELNGVPATGNRFLLTDILKKEWRFNGIVISDYVSVNEMIFHGFAKNLKQATQLAMNAGTDMDMQGGGYRKYLHQLIKEKKVSINRLDEAVRNILRIKFRLGLFNNPYKHCSEKSEKIILSDKHLEAAKESALKSIVLLKNNRNLLPLKQNAKIALIGPLAADEYHVLGTWVLPPQRQGKVISIKKALEDINANFTYTKGCKITETEPDGFEKATQISKKADVVVMALGEAEYMSGEAASKSNIKLPEIQRKLISEIKKTEKKIILILLNGRPLDLSWESQTVDAIIEAWHPGIKGGTAIVDILFGKYNPSAKLTISFPRNSGQIPIFYNQKNTGRPINGTLNIPKYTSKYLDVSNTPLYPFGFGLSYTNFEYGKINMSSKILTDNSPIRISIDIKNTGNYDGEEIVQLYIRDMVGSITRPVKELKDFKKVFIEKGNVKTVHFILEAQKLIFFNGQEYVRESGDFKLFISGNSGGKLTHDFTYMKKN